MENQQIIYSGTDAGLSRFFAKIYGLVGMGIGLSALVSAMMLFVFPQNIMAISANAPWIYYLAFFAEIGLVMAVSGTARKNHPMAMPIFLTYSALNGFTLSFILARYAQATVFQAFVSSALLFAVMAVIGATVKKDLSGVSKALSAAVIGILIASLVNIFVRSGAMSYIISLASVFIFSGLIMTHNQLVKRVYQQTGGRVGDGWAISMALSLYLDFINLFISLLRIFSRND